VGRPRIGEALKDAKEVDEINQESFLQLKADASSESVMHIKIMLFENIKNYQCS
jgi:hypothetical protein